MSPSTPKSRSEAAKKASATRQAKAALAEQAAVPTTPQPDATLVYAAADVSLTGPGAPGPKPTTLVVGETLKCQGLDGEISLSLVVPYAKIKLVMNTPEEIEESDMIDWLLQEVMDPEDAQKLLGLRDGAQTIGFAGAWMEAVGERLGASLGKSGPSSS